MRGIADVDGRESGSERSREYDRLQKSDLPAEPEAPVLAVELKVVRVDGRGERVWLLGRGDELEPGLLGSRGGNESASAALSSNGSGRRKNFIKPRGFRRFDSFLSFLSLLFLAGPVALDSCETAAVAAAGCFPVRIVKLSVFFAGAPSIL